MKILRLIAILLTVMLALGCANEPQNTQNDSVGKIYEGIAVAPDTLPQLVRLNIYTLSGMATCSGTIIGSNSVLTATHCFLAEDIYDATVVSQGIEYSLSEVLPAPGFTSNEAAIFNDLTVVKTSSPLGVPPAWLLVSTPVAVGTELYIYGFGLNESEELGVLRAGSINVDIVTENHIIDFVDGGQNTCGGDSGGPVVQAFTFSDGSPGSGIVGITSSGDGGTCTNRETAYYTNVQNPALIQFVASVVPDAVIL